MKIKGIVSVSRAEAVNYVRKAVEAEHLGSTIDSVVIDDGEITMDEHLLTRLAQSGERILAIKLYRMMNRQAGLAQAKEYIDNLVPLSSDREIQCAGYRIETCVNECGNLMITVSQPGRTYEETNGRSCVDIIVQKDYQRVMAEGRSIELGLREDPAE